MDTNISVFTSSLTCLYALVLFSFLTWMILVLTACKIYKFFSEFERFKSQNDVELNSLTWHFKKAEESREILINEIRHTNKLLYDLDKSEKKDREKIDYSHEDILRHHRKQVAQEEKEETSIETLKDAEGVVVSHKAPEDKKDLTAQKNKPHNTVELEKRLEGIQEFIDTDTGLHSLQEFRTKLLSGKTNQQAKD